MFLFSGESLNQRGGKVVRVQQGGHRDIHEEEEGGVRNMHGGCFFVLARTSGQLSVRTKTLAPSIPCGQI